MPATVMLLTRLTLHKPDPAFLVVDNSPAVSLLILKENWPCLAMDVDVKEGLVVAAFVTKRTEIRKEVALMACSLTREKSEEESSLPKRSRLDDVEEPVEAQTPSWHCLLQYPRDDVCLWPRIITELAEWSPDFHMRLCHNKRVAITLMWQSKESSRRSNVSRAAIYGVR